MKPIVQESIQYCEDLTNNLRGKAISKDQAKLYTKMAKCFTRKNAPGLPEAIEKLLKQIKDSEGK